MYAARTCARLLKQHLLGSSKLSFQRWQQTAALVAQEPFLNGSSSNYVEEMYLSWKEDPKSVHRVSLRLICLVAEHNLSVLWQKNVNNILPRKHNEMY